MIGDCRQLFPRVKYAYTCTPTYPSGQIGFIIATNDGGVDLNSKNIILLQITLFSDFLVT